MHFLLIISFLTFLAILVLANNPADYVNQDSISPDELGEMLDRASST